MSRKEPAVRGDVCQGQGTGSGPWLSLRGTGSRRGGGGEEARGRRSAELFMARLETSPRLLEDTWALQEKSGTHKHGECRSPSSASPAHSTPRAPHREHSGSTPRASPQSPGHAGGSGRHTRSEAQAHRASESRNALQEGASSSPAFQPLTLLSFQLPGPSRAWWPAGPCEGRLGGSRALWQMALGSHTPHMSPGSWPAAAPRGSEAERKLHTHSYSRGAPSR